MTDDERQVLAAFDDLDRALERRDRAAVEALGWTRDHALGRDRAVRRERGHIAGDWQDLTGELRSHVGVQRIRVEPGQWATPLHLEASEEEIFFVLEGSGVSLQWDGEQEQAFAVAAGDCLVHLALEHAHTIQCRAPTGSSSSRSANGTTRPTRSSHGPASRGSGRPGCWQGAPEDHPWKREAAAGPPVVGELAPRPSRIVNVEDVPASERRGATISRAGRDLGSAAGSAQDRAQALRRRRRACS